MPKGRLLEWRVEDGGDLLCEFLWVERPEGSFPKVKEKSEFVKLQEEMRKILMVKARDAGAEGDGE